MTKVLIDSHVLIWLLYEPERISSASRKLLEEAEAVWVSAASLWELTLKYQKGKLQYRPENFVAAVTDIGAVHLPITPEHVLALKEVATSLKDPFDRMLLAQAADQRCVFMTADRVLLQNDTPVLLQNVFE